MTAELVCSKLRNVPLLGIANPRAAHIRTARTGEDGPRLERRARKIRQASSASAVKGRLGGAGIEPGLTRILLGSREAAASRPV